MIPVPPEKSDLEAFVQAQVAVDPELDAFVEASLQGTQHLEAFVAESLRIQGAEVMDILVDIPEAPNDRLRDLWRELVFRAISPSEDQLSIEAGSVRADWNPSLHPRGPDGKFVSRPWDIPDDILGMDTSEIIREVARDDPDFAEKAADLQVDMEPDLMEVVTGVQEGAGGVEDSTDGVGSVGPISAEQVDHITSEVRRSVDFGDVNEEQGFTSLEFGQADELRETLSYVIDESDLEATSSDVQEVYDLTQDWKSDSYDDEAQTLEMVLDEALDVSPNYRNDTLDGRGPEQGEAEAAAAITAVARDFIREHHGDSITVERGVQGPGTESLMRDFLDDPQADSIEVRENTVANYAANPQVAASFGDKGVVVEREVDTDEILGGPDFVQTETSPHPYEGEVWLPGGSATVTPEDMSIHRGDESMNLGDVMSKPISEWTEEELEYIQAPLTAFIGNAEGSDLPESAWETLEQLRERTEDSDNQYVNRLNHYITNNIERGGA